MKRTIGSFVLLALGLLVSTVVYQRQIRTLSEDLLRRRQTEILPGKGVDSWPIALAATQTNPSLTAFWFIRPNECPECLDDWHQQVWNELLVDDRVVGATVLVDEGAPLREISRDGNGQWLREARQALWDAWLAEAHFSSLKVVVDTDGQIIMAEGTKPSECEWSVEHKVKAQFAFASSLGGADGRGVRRATSNEVATSNLR